MALADLGATARHILGMAKRSQGVSAAEAAHVCFLSHDDAQKRLAGLAQLGHLQAIGRGRYVDAARGVAPAPRRRRQPCRYDKRRRWRPSVRRCEVNHLAHTEAQRHGAPRGSSCWPSPLASHRW